MATPLPQSHSYYHYEVVSHPIFPDFPDFPYAAIKRCWKSLNHAPQQLRVASRARWQSPEEV